MSEMIGRAGGPRDDLGIEEEASDLVPNARGARWFRRHLIGGVVALTTMTEGAFRGSTVTAVTMVSAEPLLILVSIERDSQMDGWLSESGFFALSVLPWREQFLADQLAGFAPRASSRFEGIQYRLAVTGAPVVSACIAWVDCTVAQVVETGDHRAYIGQARAIGRGTGDAEDPLIYYLNRYRRIR
ncbi:MAG: flavin reductase family protein [Chloroflexota bacterium]